MNRSTIAWTSFVYRIISGVNFSGVLCNHLLGENDPKKDMVYNRKMDKKWTCKISICVMHWDGNSNCAIGDCNLIWTETKLLSWLSSCSSDRLSVYGLPPCRHWVSIGTVANSSQTLPMQISSRFYQMHFFSNTKWHTSCWKRPLPQGQAIGY